MKKKNNISVVIATFNSAEFIENCLKSVDWAEEIIVVDDGSTDNTVDIVKKYTKNIHFHKSVGFVEPARNFAISKASKEWVLILDADERVPQSLASALLDIGEKPEAEAYSLPRKNIIFGKWIENTGWWPDYNIRFFKKGSVTWSDEIHSNPEISGNGSELPSKEEYALTHYNYATISQFLQKMDRYTTITAKQKAADGNDFVWTDILMGPFREFLSRYFARQGYKDGLHGLVLSILMAFYEFVICLKLWELKKFFPVDERTVVREFKKIRKSQKELRYWLNTKKIDEATSKLKKQVFKTRRKLGI